jgi:hypothetical protein
MAMWRGDKLRSLHMLAKSGQLLKQAGVAGKPFRDAAEGFKTALLHDPMTSAELLTQDWLDIVKVSKGTCGPPSWERCEAVGSLNAVQCRVK